MIQVPVAIVPTPTPGNWDINTIFRKPLPEEGAPSRSADPVS